MPPSKGCRDWPPWSDIRIAVHAPKSSGSKPAWLHRVFRIRLTDCGVSAGRSILPHWLTRRNTGPVSILAFSIHRFSASIDRPIKTTCVRSSAVVVLVRPRNRDRHVVAVRRWRPQARGSDILSRQSRYMPLENLRSETLCNHRVVGSTPIKSFRSRTFHEEPHSALRDFSSFRKMYFRAMCRHSVCR